MDYFHFRADNLLHLALRCNEVYEVSPDFIKAVETAVVLAENPASIASSGYKAPKLQSGNKGRPSFIITRQQLQFCIENGFSIVAIGKMMSVSESTLKRRLKELNMSISDSYAPLEDENLDAKSYQEGIQIVDIAECMDYCKRKMSGCQRKESESQCIELIPRESF
eukprot:Seg980.9 transcript_id=Seg980.9/GoldUCD/mRNA.D3Y31 product="hypothetical protein" protein_id=Seg980.9/GoldUCD/D3Y31